MKRFFHVLLLMGFIGCKKSPSADTAVLPEWQRHLTANDRQRIDFSKYAVSKQSTAWYWQYLLKDEGKQDEFLLIETDTVGKYVSGRFVHLLPGASDVASFSGSIIIESLEHAVLLNSTITHGYIAAWHQSPFPASREAVVPGGNLPEVIVTGYYPAPASGLSFSTYLSLQSLVQNSNGGDPSYYPDSGIGIYSLLRSSNYISAGGSSTPDLAMNYETSYNNPAIDMNAWMMCFGMFPDNGSQCAVTLYCDLPVDSDPSAVYNWYTGATGHVFLELNKTRGDQSISQVIGFTAIHPFAVFGPNDQVPSKTVDNGGHKYNASVKINVTAEGLRQVIEQVKIYTANYNYNISSFNCIQYALGALNTVLGNNAITMPVLQTSGQYPPVNSPVYLYQELERLKYSNSPLAPSIQLGGPLHAGKSRGACN